ncbi:MAG: HAD-IA family hydrolase [Candidatus Izemoplasmatales bacterium]|nr:HAD-IA family hydrolase [Candidatus Izemoplasmatales bacterium]
MNPIDLLLFDLDGTLMDSNQLIIDSFKETLLIHLPGQSFKEDDIIAMIGPPLEVTLFQLSGSHTRTKAMIQTYLDVYRTREFSYIAPYPYVLEALAYFDQKHIPQAVITTKFKRSAVPSIVHFGLDRFLKAVITLDDVSHPKPHPESIFQAIRQFGARNALMIGDMPSDIQAGKRAGVLTCGVGWSLKCDALKEEKPDFWINDYRDLMAIIDRVNKEE